MRSIQPPQSYRVLEGPTVTTVLGRAWRALLRAARVGPFFGVALAGCHVAYYTPPTLPIFMQENQHAEVTPAECARPVQWGPCGPGKCDHAPPPVPAAVGPS